MLKFLKNALLTILALFLFQSLIRNIFSYKKKLDFYTSYKKQYLDETKRNKKLKSEIVKSKDYAYVEKAIREELNLLKPDEVAVILPKITPIPKVATPIQKSPIEQWIELFF